MLTFSSHLWKKVFCITSFKLHHLRAHIHVCTRFLWGHRHVLVYLLKYITSKREEFIQCCFNVGLPSSTLVEHWNSIGLMPRVWWVILTVHRDWHLVVNYCIMQLLGTICQWHCNTIKTVQSFEMNDVQMMTWGGVGWWGIVVCWVFAFTKTEILIY